MQCPIYQKISPLYERTSTQCAGRQPLVNSAPKTILTPVEKRWFLRQFERKSAFLKPRFLRLHIRYPAKQNQFRIWSPSSAKNLEISGSCVTHNSHPTWRRRPFYWSSTCQSASQERYNRKWGFPHSTRKTQAPDVRRKLLLKVGNSSYDVVNPIYNKWQNIINLFWRIFYLFFFSRGTRLKFCKICKEYIEINSF